MNASETIKQSSDDFISSNEYLNNAKNSVVYASDAVKKSSSTFINNNISYESQDKIKSCANNFSKSTKNFLGNAGEVFSNIQAHRSKVKQQKREEREVENEIKKVKMDEDKELREKERAEKEKQNQILKEETHQNNIIKIRATRTVSIEIPYHVPTDDVMHGSIKGEMMGSAAGRAMEGLFGDNNSLSSTVNAGLILGGVGSLIGGLAAASDDGIRWNTAQLYIADDEIIISGKYSLSFDEIKLISVGKYKSSDVIVFTLQNQGLEFKTDDALALKIVIEEYIQKYNSNKKSPGNVDDLLKYGELYEKGIITKEELEMKKKELL